MDAKEHKYEIRHLPYFSSRGFGWFRKFAAIVILFYNKTCQSDVSRIQKEYERIYIKEILNTVDNNTDKKSCLHYQRRLLAQFFVDLEKCANTQFYYIGRNRVEKDFTVDTRQLVKILYFMGVAIENSKILFKKIDCNERLPESTRVKGQNKYLCHMYELLKQTKPYMR